MTSSPQEPWPANQTSPALPRRWGLGFGVLILGAAVALIWLGTRPARGPAPGDAIGWQRDYQEARSQAQVAGKPLLVNFTADWCPPCQAMRRGAFADPSVVETIRAGFVPVEVDLTRSDSPGTAVATKFGVQAIPTRVVLDAQGQEAARQVGGVGASQLVEWLKPWAERRSEVKN